MNKTLVFLILVIAVNCTTENKSGELPMYLEGSWGWGECENNKHKIKYSPNKEFLEFNTEDGSYRYYIAGMEEKGFKVVMLNEDRYDSNGNPVYWYIVFDGEDTYYWLRSDRKEDDLRGPIERCK